MEAAMTIRPIRSVSTSQPALEGAGVRLRRAFGFGETEPFDPFLLLDDFRNDRPEDFLAGFPWHPHRGIETITYVLAGTVEHGDSLGNQGVIGPGDVQWMTAGSGIIHQEMPQGDEAGRMHGFQLWLNLPREHKMTPPRYQEVVRADIPETGEDDGTIARVVCGSLWGVSGPVDGIAGSPAYLDISVPAGVTRRIPVSHDRHAFAYVFEGEGRFDDASEPGPTPGSAVDRSLVLFDAGDEVVVRAGERGMRFLLVSGQPFREPVAWHGPIVMNTQGELKQAFAELQDGTFLR
jgi:redox-sensitive bicupin YhaK (pirin superfamily)